MEWTATRVRALRAALRLSQEDFAAYLGAAPRSVRGWEADKHAPMPVNLRALDTALDRLTSAQRQEFDAAQSRSAAGSHSPERLMPLPGGRAFSGTVVALEPHQDGRPLHGLQRTLAVSRRTEGLFAMDAWGLRRRPGNVIPSAYLLDDFTYAILWAVANLDDALLADDAALDEARAAVVDYEQLRGSAVSRDAVRALFNVSQMWLGSHFCVRHILRNSENLLDVPTFWTSEQRGEEACNWLLFKDKYVYLEKVRERFGKTTRIFCVPESAVQNSASYERILLFLAIALMESLGIEVCVTVDPVYASVGGFVLTPGSRVLIANWVRAEGVWHVDNTAQKGIVRECEEVAGEGVAKSAVAAPTSMRRLRALADYLDIEWNWLVRRSSELASQGTASFTTPRSRLLSCVGLDAACAYVGGFRPFATAA